MKTYQTARVGGRILAAFLLLCGIDVSGQSSVAFNVSGAADTVQKEMFGLLMERLGRQWSGSGSIWVGTGSSIPNTNGMRTDVINGLREAGVGAIQWPGGCAANSYNWESVGPNPPNDVGTDRFIQFCDEIGCEPLICGRAQSQYAAANTRWIRHIDSQMTSRGMGRLRWFKVGNEVWGACGTPDWNVNTYMTNFTANYNQIRTYRTDVLLEAGNDCEGNWGWLTTMINGIGSQINGVEYHDYIYYPNNCPGDNPSNAWYWQIMYDVGTRDFGAHIRNNVIPAINSANPDQRIKLIVDEWGDWLIDEGDGWMQQVILMDAISAGMHLHIMMPYAKRITVACVAQGVNVIHSLININTSGVMVKTPVFYVFKMLIPHHTNNAKWCPITASSIETTRQTTQNNGTVTMPVLTVAATVDDSQYVNVSFTNMDMSSTRQATVTLTSSQSSYTVASAQVVTGGAINATNNFGASESVNIQTLNSSNYTMNTKTLTVTLPARSVVMFRLAPHTAAQPAGVQVKAPDDFSIKAGPRGAVLVTSSVMRKTPVTIGLYGIDGRAASATYRGTLEPGQKSLVWRPERRAGGTNVYIVKLQAGETARSQRIVLSR